MLVYRVPILRFIAQNYVSMQVVNLFTSEAFQCIVMAWASACPQAIISYMALDAHCKPGWSTEQA